jgi:rRNA processing protein Gar1
VSSLLYCKITSIVGDTLIAEADSAHLPKLGSKAFLRNMELGRVVDVIGNVRKPYCAVKLKKKIEKEKVVGEKISFGG